MIVPDATKDERFVDNPLVTEMGVRFYAGAPLVNSKGYKLGTLCIYDMQPKTLTQKQITALLNMSKQVMIATKIQPHGMMKFPPIALATPKPIKTPKKMPTNPPI